MGESIHISELADGNGRLTNECDVRFRAYRMVYNVKLCISHQTYIFFLNLLTQGYAEDVRD